MIMSSLAVVGMALRQLTILRVSSVRKTIAVLEKGWIGGGNVGRNTTIIRSNYLLDGNEPFYEFSLKLWEGLEQDLNYNAMVSQRGILNLIHSDAQRDAFIRRGNAMMLNGADAEMLTTGADQSTLPFPELLTMHASPSKAALPSIAAAQCAMMRWLGAMPAVQTSRGVDIIQNCEVTGFQA